MFSLELGTEAEAKDILIAELWEQGSTGIVETDLPGGRCGLRAFFEDEADTDSLLRLFPGRIERHAPRDWVEFSRANWEPFCVGSRFFLVPDWRHDPTPPGRLRIEINPGLAFGTGFHETTQLCLEALEQSPLAGMTVLDVGAGSGILAIASALLGARRVVACDVDRVAVEIAGANFRRSEVDALLFIGSVDAVRSGSIDVVVANISASASIELAPEFVRSLAAGGRCILSGFEDTETETVQAAVERAGAVVERKLAKGRWCGLIVSGNLPPTSI